MATKSLDDVTEVDILVGCDRAEELGLHTLPVDRPFECCYLRFGCPAWVAELLATRLEHRRCLAPILGARALDAKAGEFSYGHAASANRRWRPVVAFRREAVMAVLGTFLADPVPALGCGWESMRYWFHTHAYEGVRRAYRVRAKGVPDAED